MKEKLGKFFPITITSILFAFLLYFALVAADEGITTIFNFGNQFLEYRDTVHGLLKSSSWVILGLLPIPYLVYYILKKQLRKNFLKIPALLIIGAPFIFLNFETSIMDKLWNEYNYFAANIFTGLPYVSPLDPFQHFILFPIFLLKSSCENLLIAGKKYLLKRFSKKT